MSTSRNSVAAHSAPVHRLYSLFAHPAWTLASFLLAFFAVSWLLSVGRGTGFTATVATSLLVAGVVEAVSFWFLVWFSLAWLSTRSWTPAALAGHLGKAVESFAPKRIKRLVRGTTAFAFTGGMLVAGPALADDLPSDLLWDNPLETVTSSAHVWPSEDSALESHQAPQAVDHHVETQGETALEPSIQDSAGEVEKTGTPQEASPQKPDPQHTYPQATRPKAGRGRPAAKPMESVAGVGSNRDVATGGVRGVSVPRSGVSPTAKARRQAPPLAPELESPVVTQVHVVEPGDCLWRIAEDLLPENSSDALIDSLWKEIYALNEVTIGADPNLIEPGQQLILPVQPPVEVELEEAA